MDKRGFAVSSIIYAILILFLALTVGILGLLGNRKLILDRLKNDVILKLNNEEISKSLYSDNSGAAIPELYEGMIPVVYDGTNFIYADVHSKWYDYDLKEWANAVVLNDGVTKTVGDIITESDIALWYVWIPRYKYKIFNTGNYNSAIKVDKKPTETKVQEIEIVFENKTTTKSTGTTFNSYLTHPAFTFGDKELNGIWVGKFESSNKENSSTDDSSLTLTIKPNVSSWRSVSVYNAFIASQNVASIYNLTNSDTHMMKNTEWGAVAYLSHSKYGINDEVRINNNSNYVTGCGAYAKNKGETENCQIAFGNSTDYPQSTTGNITGVFDMNGGAFEAMAAYIDGYFNTSGFNSTNIVLYDSKYFDVYPSDFSKTSYNKRILGDATGELGPFYYYDTFGNGTKRYHSTWYSDYAELPRSTLPWFARGGRYSAGILGGEFAIYYNIGGPGSIYSFRVVLVSK